MKVATTIFLALVALSLVLLAVGDGNQWMAKLFGASPPPELPKIDSAKITGFSIVSSQAKVEVARDPRGVWMLTSPMADRADPERMAKLVTAVGQWSRVNALTKKDLKRSGQSFDAFGLAASQSVALRVLSGTDVLANLTVGSAGHATDSCHVSLDGGSILTITSNLRPLLDGPAEFFLDPALARFSPEALESVSWRREGESGWALERSSAERPWRLIRPMHVRADADRVNAMLSELAKAKTEGHVPLDQAEAMLRAASQNKQVLTLKQGESSLELTIFPATEAGVARAFAQVSGRPFLFKVPVSLLQVVPPDALSLRDRKLARLNPADVRKLTVSSPGAPAVRLEQVGTQWFFLGENDAPGALANAERAESLFKRLNAEPVAKHLADSPGGLTWTAPTLTLTFEGDKLGPANDSLVMRFAAQEGDHAYAQTEGEPGVAVVSWTLLSGLDGFGSASFWKSLDVLNVAIETFRVVTLAPATGEPLTLRLDPKQDPAKKLSLHQGQADVSQRLDNRKAVELLLTLSALSAKRWISAAEEARPLLEKPALFVGIETEVPGEEGQPAKKEVTRVRFAPTSLDAADPEFYFGQVEGQPDVFLLGKDDFKRLRGDGVLLQ